jgi:hypothetical protein
MARFSEMDNTAISASGRISKMANIRMYPTTDYLRKETGYCVEIEGTDACGEFHSGTPEENRENAKTFVNALVERQDQKRETAMLPDGWTAVRTSFYNELLQEAGAMNRCRA